MSQSSFLEYWTSYRDKTLEERRIYFESLPKQHQASLLNSFFNEGWDRYFAQIYIDQILDLVKKNFNLDLVDLRIKALKSGRVFLIEKEIWDYIERELLEFQDYYNTDVLFGGLLISPWGKRKQFYKIRAKGRNIGGN